MQSVDFPSISSPAHQALVGDLASRLASTFLDIEAGDGRNAIPARPE
jgi:hypothetical protein